MQKLDRVWGLSGTDNRLLPSSLVLSNPYVSDKDRIWHTLSIFGPLNSCCFSKALAAAFNWLGKQVLGCCPIEPEGCQQALHPFVLARTESVALYAGPCEVCGSTSSSKWLPKANNKGCLCQRCSDIQRQALVEASPAIEPASRLPAEQPERCADPSEPASALPLKHLSRSSRPENAIDCTIFLNAALSSASGRHAPGKRHCLDAFRDAAKLFGRRRPSCFVQAA